MRMFVRAFLLFSAVCILQSLVSAGTLTVASSGVFSNVVPTTTWSAPNVSWSLSFTVPDTPVPVAGSVDSIGFDVPFSNFSYLLGGGTVATSPVRIRFFIDIAGGLLGVNFVDTTTPPDGTPSTGFAFFGPQAFSNTTDAPTILPGSYTAGSGFFYAGDTPVQDLSNTRVSITAPTVTADPASSVPEPATVAMVAAACCVLGWMRRGQVN